MKHTADNLKFYLGKDVLVLFPNGGKEKHHLSGRFYDDVIIDLFHYFSDYIVYPILKTVDEHSDPDLNGRFEIINHDYLPAYGMKSYELTLSSAIDFINNGFGAIPSEESPTGYVDFFGNPCVTPKQVEEGGNYVDKK